MQYRFPVGELLPKIVRCSRQALAGGALRPIQTQRYTLIENDVRYSVRKVASLARKSNAKQTSPQLNIPDNPFLPYDPDLFVTDVSDTHVCLLNKFNVVDNHVLIVTREFEHQETLLTIEDMQALWLCMQEFSSLGFYNGGEIAGASQVHKHLQLIPLPIDSGGYYDVPTAALIESASYHNGVSNSCGFPFVHAAHKLDENILRHTQRAPEYLWQCYQRLLESTGIVALNIKGEARQSQPYNLLLTKRWMMLVPRRQECYDNISINALGFAGSFFVRDDTQYQLIRTVGPTAILRGVSLALQ
ncbi:ATP adenylyltransferase family protein [Kaarinaea lacus]